MDRSQQQIIFFKKLKEYLAPHLSMVDMVSDLLNISQDSAYRRIRGEKLLEFDEIQNLCLQFDISFDQFLSVKSNSFLFTGILPTDEEFVFRTWLESMLQHFEFINTFSEPHFYWFVRDFPVPIHFQIPELAAFKMFFWERSILENPDSKRLKFSCDNLDDPNLDLAAQLANTYNAIPTTEIWNVENISATLRQIEYYRKISLFASSHDIEIIYNRLEQLVDHVEKQAESGKKFFFGDPKGFNSAPYTLYENDLISGDGTSISQIGEVKITFLVHSFINIVSTMNPRFNEYTFKSMNNLIRKSTLISSSGEASRRIFFQKLRDKIYSSRKKE